MAQTQPEVVSKVISQLVPALSGPYETRRIMIAALFAEVCLLQ